MEYEAFADAYGWTPKQVDTEVPHLLRSQIMIVRGVRREITEEREAEARKG